MDWAILVHSRVKKCICISSTCFLPLEQLFSFLKFCVVLWLNQLMSSIELDMRWRSKSYELGASSHFYSFWLISKKKNVINYRTLIRAEYTFFQVFCINKPCVIEVLFQVVRSEGLHNLSVSSPHAAFHFVWPLFFTCKGDLLTNCINLSLVYTIPLHWYFNCAGDVSTGMRDTSWYVLRM